MDQESVQIIVGMKLGYYRDRAGISLKELSGLTGLSTSYINEIEKGKKFPKIEKMIQLANGLGITYDELTSTRLDGKLTPLAGVLNSPMIQQFPFHIFGTSARELLQMMGRHPHEMGVLARMLQEMGSSYDMRMEHFFQTALRCYQMIHNNYFSDLEDMVDGFRKRLQLGPTDLVTHEHVRLALIEGTGYAVLEKDASALPASLASQRYFVHPGRKEFWVNRRLSSAQRGFMFARELGYHFLNIKDRPMTSPTLQVKSFEHLFDNFRTSYFAGALLLPRKRFQLDLKRIFAMTRWEDACEALLQLPTTYGVTPETLFYRLSELVPQFFRTRSVHFTKFSKHEGQKRGHMEKQFNMSKLHIPNGTGLNESFCGRWLSVMQLHAVEQNPAGSGPVMAAQRSKFLDFGTEFFCITVAYRGTLRPGEIFSDTLGFPINSALKSTIKFYSDAAIPFRELGQTCERCPLLPGHCEERLAEPHLYAEEQASAEREEALMQLLGNSAPS